MTEEKLTLGSSACEWVFDDFSKTEQSDDAVKESRKQKVLKKFGTCLLNNIDKIIDDATGAKIVSGCGESEKLPDLARAVSQIFSESFRIRYEHDRQRLENAKQKEASNPLDLNILNVTKDDRFNPIIIDINGDLKTCFKIGVVLSCD